MAVGVRQRWMRWASCDQIPVRGVRPRDVCCCWGSGASEERPSSCVLGSRIDLLPSLYKGIDRQVVLTGAPLQLHSKATLQTSGCISRQDVWLLWGQFTENSSPFDSHLRSFLFSISLLRPTFSLFLDDSQILVLSDQSHRNIFLGKKAYKVLLKAQSNAPVTERLKKKKTTDKRCHEGGCWIAIFTIFAFYNINCIFM